jgi:opacity protein-like surface antigen
MGIAVGYVEGEVQPKGLSQVDQEGSYVALYGEHGLKKLNSTSCVSMDWVAAYGITDSEVNGLSWEQDSVQLNSRLSWNKAINNRTTVSAFGGLEYFADESDTVDGVKTGSIQNLRGEIGVGVRYAPGGMITPAAAKRGLTRPACERLVLHGELRYMNDMVRSNPVTRMDGLSGSGEANPGRYGFGIEAGATYRINDRWSASANYEYNNMNDSREHRVNVGASYTF